MSLTNAEISRYGRQLILPEFGPIGQTRLRQSAVLVVGAGGLGSSAILLLAASGVGRLGIIDGDFVEESNLHRQIIHGEAAAHSRVSKVHSALNAVRNINSGIPCEGFEEGISPENAVRIINNFDVVVDCTDNLAARYLINDACVLLRKPLVSGAAQGLEGQLSVYWVGREENDRSGPYADNMRGQFPLIEDLGCYRCAFPTPPGPEHRGSCNNNGVLGPVPATIGSLQALEAIKVCTVDGILWQSRDKSDITGLSGCGKPQMLPVTFRPLLGRLLMLDFRDLSSSGCRTVKLRKDRRSGCSACGPHPTLHSMADSRAFCVAHGLMDAPCIAQSSPSPVGVLTSRITCSEYHELWADGKRQHVLIDVRPMVQYSICALPGAICIPFTRLSEELDYVRELAGLQSTQDHASEPLPIILVCRRGNDSQRAAWLLAATAGFNPENIFDLVGGITKWSVEIDENFPGY